MIDERIKADLDRAARAALAALNSSSVVAALDRFGANLVVAGTNVLMCIAFGLLVGAATFYLLNYEYLPALEARAALSRQAALDAPNRQARNFVNAERERMAQTEAANKVLAAVLFTEFLFDTNPRARSLDIMSRLNLSDKIREPFGRDLVRDGVDRFFHVSEECRWAVTGIELPDDPSGDGYVGVKGIQYGPLPQDGPDFAQVGQRMYFVTMKLELRPDVPLRSVADGYISKGVYEVAAFVVRDEKMNVVSKYGDIE